jgi:hypothetical protein
MCSDQASGLLMRGEYRRGQVRVAARLKLEDRFASLEVVAITTVFKILCGYE